MGFYKIIYNKFSPNQPPWPKYWELSLGTIFIKLSGPETLRKSKVTTGNIPKRWKFNSVEMEPV